MGVKMTMLVNLILILTLLQHPIESNIMDDENVKLSLQYLCPGVDICILKQRHSNLIIEPIGERPYGSCCIGCSCDKDCALLMNCCFPSDEKEIPNSNTSSTFDNGNASMRNSSLKINRKGLQSNEEDASNIKEIGVASGEDIRTQGHRLTTISSLGSERIQAHINDTSDTTNEIATLSDVDMTVDYNSTSIDMEFGANQCLYARTGTLNNIWIEGVPSYRMVTSSPPGGCIKGTICTALTQQNKQATCDSGTVFPWGDLFPVYSDEHKLVFKNELCACCNGVLDYKPWSPLLKCIKYDSNGGRLLSISEHLSFLQGSKSFPDQCNVHFEYDDSQVLRDNKCNVNTIETCQLPSDFLFRVPDGVNLTRSEINAVCNNGPDAPFIATSVHDVQGVFKNVFCAICNNIINETRQCDIPYSGSSSKGKFTHLLDVASLQRSTNTGKREQVESHPYACLKKNDTWIEDSCREIGCPSGQLRDVDGVCTFPSENWFADGFEVTVNLEYITSNTTILRMLNKEYTRKDDFVNAFRNTSPWPSNWVITKILHTTDDYQFGPRLAVFLLSRTISRPETLTAHIKTTMGLNWTVVLNGIDFAFEQSFLKYDIVYSHVRASTETYIFEPIWLLYLNDIGPNIKVPLNEIAFWELLAEDVLWEIPFTLNKLLICEHISLLENEYILMGFSTILVNLLTNKVMLNKEFEVVQDEDYKMVVHICLADSSFVLNSEKSGAPASLNLIHHLVWVKHLITVVIAACAPVFLRNH